ncbi:hypothetical protein R84B8_02513 [Treponema sp. R8-4-B8]
MKLYDFSEQGFIGFTTISNKSLLSEAIYQTNRLFIIRESASKFDFSSETDNFSIGVWLYTDTNDYFSIKVDINAPLTKLPRHIDIIKKYSNEIGAIVTEENQYEINRTFNRGFNLWEPETKTYTIFGGTFMKNNREENAQFILDDFNVPKDTNVIVNLNSSLDKI